MFKEICRPLRLLRFAAALASILLLAGPPALASSTAQCWDAWADSSADDTCKDESMEFGDWNNCPQCCNIFATCHTGAGVTSNNQWNHTSIGAPVSEVDDIQNCQGSLTNGSC